MTTLTRTRLWVAVTLASLVTSGSARSDGGGPHLTVSPYAGWAFWSERVDIENRPLLGAHGGLMLGRYVGLEAAYGITFTQSDSTSGDVTAQHLGADLLLKPGFWGPVHPYVLGGWSTVWYDPGGFETQSFNGWEAGGGLLVHLGESWHVRLEARDVFFKVDPPFVSSEQADSFNHNVFVTAGIQIALGGSQPDEDADGIPDHRDRCPGTLAQAIVDIHGCPFDSDDDGVPDGIDQCAGTQPGARVNSAGCTTDSDQDGIVDGIDVCDDTPAGAFTDESGCPMDSDGDGVFDGIDQCTGTAPDVRVDASGCPIDSDGDGVFDGIDQCAGTPAGTRVDRRGCPITEKEVELLDTGTLRLTGIRFDSGQATIKHESFAALDEVGEILSRWPELRIEIGGHTDSQGSAALNLTLSEKRAQAVLDYLKRSFPQIGHSQFSARGYGEGKPIASNESAEGRAQNRRVEFRVLNREQLRRER